LVRLASLQAAETLADMELVPGRLHALTGDRQGQFALSLWGSQRLVLVPDEDPLPLLADGGLDRERVTKLNVLEVVDDHGD
jgi:proteic killer suppression protein